MSKFTRSSSGQTPLSERSCFNEAWVLPPVREGYLRAHTSTRLAQLHSSQDPNIIKPSWLKVSSTPFNQSANLRSGYGVKIETSTISKDAPTFFADPCRQYKSQRPQSSSLSRRDAVPFESSLVLPGGRSILASSQSFHSTLKGFKGHKFTHMYADTSKNLVFLDHVDPPTSRPPIDWDRKRTERCMSARF